jgi:hypothetical protein
MSSSILPGCVAIPALVYSSYCERMCTLCNPESGWDLFRTALTQMWAEHAPCFESGLSAFYVQTTSSEVKKKISDVMKGENALEHLRIFKDECQGKIRNLVLFGLVVKKERTKKHACATLLEGGAIYILLMRNNNLGHIVAVPLKDTKALTNSELFDVPLALGVDLTAALAANRLPAGLVPFSRAREGKEILVTLGKNPPKAKKPKKTKKKQKKNESEDDEGSDSDYSVDDDWDEETEDSEAEDEPVKPRGKRAKKNMPPPDENELPLDRRQVVVADPKLLDSGHLRHMPVSDLILLTQTCLKALSTTPAIYADFLESNSLKEVQQKEKKQGVDEDGKGPKVVKQVHDSRPPQLDAAFVGVNSETRIELFLAWYTVQKTEAAKKGVNLNVVTMRKEDDFYIFPRDFQSLEKNCGAGNKKKVFRDICLTLESPLFIMFFMRRFIRFRALLKKTNFLDRAFEVLNDMRDMFRLFFAFGVDMPVSGCLFDPVTRTFIPFENSVGLEECCSEDMQAFYKERLQYYVQDEDYPLCCARNSAYNDCKDHPDFPVFCEKLKARPDVDAWMRRDTVADPGPMFSVLMKEGVGDKEVLMKARPCNRMGQPYTIEEEPGVESFGEYCSPLSETEPDTGKSDGHNEFFAPPRYEGAGCGLF